MFVSFALLLSRVMLHVIWCLSIAFMRFCVWVSPSCDCIRFWSIGPVWCWNCGWVVDYVAKTYKWCGVCRWTTRVVLKFVLLSLRENRHPHPWAPILQRCRCSLAGVVLSMLVIHQRPFWKPHSVLGVPSFSSKIFWEPLSVLGVPLFSSGVLWKPLSVLEVPLFSSGVFLKVP
jgi:hypothetical protein